MSDLRAEIDAQQRAREDQLNRIATLNADLADARQADAAYRNLDEAQRMAAPPPPPVQAFEDRRDLAVAQLDGIERRLEELRQHERIHASLEPVRAAQADILTDMSGAPGVSDLVEAQTIFAAEQTRTQTEIIHPNPVYVMPDHPPAVGPEQAMIAAAIVLETAGPMVRDAAETVGDLALEHLKDEAQGEWLRTQLDQQLLQQEQSIEERQESERDSMEANLASIRAMQDERIAAGEVRDPDALREALDIAAEQQRAELAARQEAERAEAAREAAERARQQQTYDDRSR